MTPSGFVDHSTLAESDTEAESRFRLAKKNDPFPEISDALLNSADIYDYVRMTGMLHPFHEDNLKSGSYEAAIGGRCIWWDENGNHHEKLLVDKGRDEFILKANSIAFVQVEPLFRLPDYIALRFNLKITHVHRGILLGTGPLIDPGFEGRLLIPLHNLTTNEYTLKCGDGLIWIEFTKTSSLPCDSGKATNALGLSRRGTYVPFPKNKKHLQPDYYLAKASPHAPIRSSISTVVKESERAAKQAADASTKSASEAETTRKRADRVLGFFSIAAVIALATAVYATWDLIHNAWKTVTEAQQQLQQAIQNGGSQSKEVEQLSQKIQSVEAKILEEVSSLRTRFDSLNSDVQGLRGIGKESKPKHVPPDGQSSTR